MAKQSSVNLDITVNADGFDITGGSTTKRKMTLTGADLTLSGLGANVITFPNELNAVLVSTTLTQTLTNKTLTSPVINSPTISSPFTLGSTSVTATGTQFNYLNQSTGTTGVATSSLVFSNAPTFTGTVTSTNNLLVGSNNLFVDTVNNRVGINNGSPIASLDVVGDGKISTNLLVNGELQSTRSINSASPAYGVVMNIANAGAGGSYAARFNGSEVVASAVGGTQDKKIKISIGGVDYFIPAYTA